MVVPVACTPLVRWSSWWTLPVLVVDRLFLVGFARVPAQARATWSEAALLLLKGKLVCHSVFFFFKHRWSTSLLGFLDCVCLLLSWSLGGSVPNYLGVHE